MSNKVRSTRRVRNNPLLLDGSNMSDRQIVGLILVSGSLLISMFLLFRLVCNAVVYFGT